MAKSKKSFNKKNKNKSIKLGGSFIFGTSFETKKKVCLPESIAIKYKC